MYKFSTLTYFFIVFLVLVGSLDAQSPEINVELSQKFKQAKGLLVSFKNDSAFIVLTELIKDLKAQGQLDTPFGLRVQHREAEALENDHQDAIAIQKLLYLKEHSKEKKVWDVFGNSSLALARLYEKIGRDSSCLVHLRETQSAIKKYPEIDSLYPLFAIRYSSYHRIYNNQDTALFYAREVLRTAPLFNQKEEAAVGHMLMGMLTDDPAPDARLKHYKAAAKTFKEIEDYSGYTYMIGSVSAWYLNNKQYKIALTYNDSMIEAKKKSILYGHELRRGLIYAYQIRANIYKKMNAFDSAWYYVNKAHRIELDFIHQSNNEEVIEIDNRYKSEKRAEKIEEQAAQIKFEKDRRNFFTGIASVLFLMGSLLTYYYLRLRKANNKTEEQALVIGKTNKELTSSLEEQMVLQGEIHHRVKNNLQVIISLLDLQREELDNPETRQNLQAMSNRIYSMAAIHELLYQREGIGLVSVREYAENLCQHFNNLSSRLQKAAFDLNIENKLFNLETLMPLGIILTELLTNSLKYASDSEKQLIISIDMKTYADGFYLLYKDNGPGFSKGQLTEREGGLGSYLLKSMSRQLSGHFESYNDKGAVSKIFFKEKNK